MKPTVDNTPPAKSPLGRYLPIGVIVVLLIGIGVAISVSGGDDAEATDADTTGEGSGGDGGDAEGEEPGDPDGAVDGGPDGPPEPTGRMPITYAEAVEAGTVDDYEWGDRCDTERGTVALASVYAPPCVPVWEGDNGGATTPGVTADTITIVRYQASADDQFTALLDTFGAADTAEETAETFRGYVEALTSRSELYGREIEIIDFPATGPGDDTIASQADAESIVEDHRPFAVVGGPATDGGTFAQELARNDVLCFGCGLAVPTQFIYDNAPYLWGPQISVDQLLEELAAWSNRSEEGQEARGEEPGTAIFAQDEDLAAQDRKVGVIHFEQDPPLFDATADDAVDLFEQGSSLRETYLFDFSTMQTRAAELIAKMKAEGATTIMFLGDPVMPIYLTQQATAQDYWPEWIFTGTALTDTNVLGRLYDQEQMRAAYGVSPLGVPVPQTEQGSVKVWRWYHGDDTFPPARSQYGLQVPPALWLMQGIHMAGPDLTAETFRDGLFRMPPAGGFPSAPQASYGHWGLFSQPDYVASDDLAEIWWDPEAEATDERGCPGVGGWYRSHGGERFTIEDPPLPAPFVEDDAVLLLEEPSFDVPDYPAPPGSPAVEGVAGRGADTELVECEG